MSEDSRLSRYFGVPESEANLLFYSIEKLEKVNGCEDITTELTKKLENLFVDVPEKKCEKELDGLVYYENGLITKKGEATAIIASPWLSTTVIKEPKKKPEKHAFNYLKNLTKKRAYYYDNKFGSAIYYQMRLYNKSNVPYHSIKMDLMGLLKRIEAFLLLSEEERNLTGICFPWQDSFDIIHKLKNFLAEGYYLTDKQCEEVLLIFDTFPNEDVQDIGYWRTNNLGDSCKNYLNNPQTLGTLDKNYNIVYRKYCEFTNKSYNECADLLVDVYKDLYSIKETNFRTLLTKVGLIEEGYMPNFIQEEEQNRPSGD